MRPLVLALLVVLAACGQGEDVSTRAAACAATSTPSVRLDDCREFCAGSFAEFEAASCVTTVVPRSSCTTGVAEVRSCSCTRNAAGDLVCEYAGVAEVAACGCGTNEGAVPVCAFLFMACSP